MRSRLCFLALLLAFPAAAFAQTTEGGPDLSRVPVRIGPLYLAPTLSLTNLGVDTNVFNETNLSEPKSDFTFTLTPAADAWLRLGRTWLNLTVKEDIVWYQKFASERSGNPAYTVGWQVPLNRISLNVASNWLNTRERPGFEIDQRARRVERGYRASVEVRALAKTLFGVRGEHRKVNFDETDDNDLAFGLNRTITTGAITIRHELTPLTSLTLSVGSERQDFESSPERDSTSTLVLGGISFDPAALIKGNATFGYRDFKPSDPTVPPFTGSTMSLSLTYVAGGATQITVGGIRDVEYSFSLETPYYVQTGGTAQLAQQIYGPVEVVARIGAQRLGYRERGAAANDPASRTDHVRSYGGGFGYHMGQNIRIGADVNQQKRTSPESEREYEGLRFGMSVTYGL